MVGSTELESVTSCVSSRRSNQLSYEPQSGYKHEFTIPRPYYATLTAIKSTSKARSTANLVSCIDGHSSHVD